MKLLTTIYRHEDIKNSGRTITREAVRAIIQRGDQLLMVYSPINGDYKFPGGGVNEGESHIDALLREIREETGNVSAQIIDEFGSVLEYDRPIEEDFDIFKMTSYYYTCRVGDERTSQMLDDYEANLGFTPTWVNIDTAIQTNHDAMENPSAEFPRWTIRETFILERLKEMNHANA